MPACSLRGLWGSEEEAFPFSECLVKVHGDRSCSSRGPVSPAPAPAHPPPPTPAVVQVFLGDPQSCSGQGCGLGEHSRSFWGAELFSMVPAAVLVLVTWNNVPETQAALRPQPHTPPLGVLVLPAQLGPPSLAPPTPSPCRGFHFPRSWVCTSSSGFGDDGSPRGWSGAPSCPIPCQSRVPEDTWSPPP